MCRQRAHGGGVGGRGVAIPASHPLSLISAQDNVIRTRTRLFSTFPDGVLGGAVNGGELASTWEDILLLLGSSTFSLDACLQTSIT